MHPVCELNHPDDESIGEDWWTARELGIVPCPSVRTIQRRAQQGLIATSPPLDGRGTKIYCLRCVVHTTPSRRNTYPRIHDSEGWRKYHQSIVDEFTPKLEKVVKEFREAEERGDDFFRDRWFCLVQDHQYRVFWAKRAVFAYSLSPEEEDYTASCTCPSPVYPQTKEGYCHCGVMQNIINLREYRGEEVPSWAIRKR